MPKPLSRIVGDMQLATICYSKFHCRHRLTPISHRYLSPGKCWQQEKAMDKMKNRGEKKIERKLYIKKVHISNLLRLLCLSDLLHRVKWLKLFSILDVVI